MLGEEFGQLLSFLYTEIRDMIVFVYEERLFDMTVVMELFIQIYNLFEEETVSAKDVKEAIYWYISDYSDEMVGRRVREGVDPDLDFATNIIMNQDLTDPRYLYRFGEYVDRKRNPYVTVFKQYAKRRQVRGYGAHFYRRISYWVCCNQ